MHEPNPDQVRRRRVFYIPGYDPFPPRRYRELYRKEAAAQAAISGYEIAMSPQRNGGPYGWNVTARIEGAETETDIEVLVWSDIVRGSMGQSIPATYWQLVRTAWIYVSTGALFGLMRLRKGPVIAALYPIFALVIELCVALVLGSVAARVIAPMIWLLPLGAVATAFGAHLAAEAVIYWTVFLAVVWAVLRVFRSQDRRLFAYYLMHDYAFTAALRGANPPELEKRLSAFEAAIAKALQSDVDEVLVVGHSSGAHLAVTVLADLIRAQKVARNGPALGFLSLGQVVPMVSFLPAATRLRGDLAFLSARDELSWVDVTAPGDGCAFALCDPVCVSGVAPQGKRWPLVISAAFTQTLSPERWLALKRRYFRLHFQYLCAFDRPGDYDYFRITAGPQTLAARFRGRAPSKSRIETMVNRYQGTE